jgi:hypothetical protein
VAAGVSWDALLCDGVDDTVIARAAEERGEPLFLADPREDLRAGHREARLRRL